MPRVSIGLPIYNGENFLAEAVEALLAQTFTDFELVLVDNASTDRTVEMCDGFVKRDKRVRYHRNEQNIGGAPNFNLAFALANRSPYFKWAAHDDRHLPDFLAACVPVLDADPGISVAFCGAEIIDETGTVVRGYDPELPNTADPRPSTRFRDLVMVEHWAFDSFGLMRRETLEKTPLHGSYVGSDRVLLADLGLRGRFHRDPRVLFQSRDYGGRSIRAQDIRSRGGWFNPKLEGKIILPHWRYFFEFARTPARVPLPVSERAACWRAVVDWGRENGWAMKGDLRAAVEKLRERGPAALGR